MRIWLAGSKTFGAQVLQMIADMPLHSVVGVTTPAGDKLELAAQKQAGVGWISHEVSAYNMRKHKVDLIVSAQNYEKIGTEARVACRYGAIGYHPSLLPRHRGRYSVEWTIASGDAIAGGTVYQLDDGMDTGLVLARQSCHVVPGWTASDLWRERLFSIGLHLLQAVINNLDLYRGEAEIQDERVATEEKYPPTETTIIRLKDMVEKP